jgi:hypothetical protein
VGVPYAYRALFSGSFAGEYTIACLSHPSWLTVDVFQDSVYGTPTTAKTDTVKFTLTETAGSYADTLVVSITVIDPARMPVSNFSNEHVSFGLSVQSNPKGVNFSIGLETAEDISLDIYNLFGQHLWSYSATVKNAGSYSVIWNPSLEQQVHGIYFALLRQGARNAVKRFVVVR